MEPVTVAAFIQVAESYERLAEVIADMLNHAAEAPSVERTPATPPT
jgi:hypothetical protein